MTGQILRDFYQSAPALAQFAEAVDTSHYLSIPDGWIIGLADIVNSTDAIAKGRYKAVNLVGASVIAGILNALDDQSFPFSFGGDGAAFALPGSMHSIVASTLAALQIWSREEIGLTLRTSIVPIEVIRRAGHDVSVARLQVAPQVAYAMFAGGGLSWAEEQMKAGAYIVPPAAPGTRPDLSGLSCRWSPIAANKGKILSLLVLPKPGQGDGKFESLIEQLLDLIEHDDKRQGHPIPAAGPEFSLRAHGLDLEVHTSRANRPYWLKYITLRILRAFLWGIFKAKQRIGKFDPVTYQLDTTANTDFRKFDDGLKLTVDCTLAVIANIETVLRQAHEAGIADYGVHCQDQALMTCFVPSPILRDHMHFVDGADGGYAKAAEALKARKARGTSTKI